MLTKNSFFDVLLNDIISSKNQFHCDEVISRTIIDLLKSRFFSYYKKRLTTNLILVYPSSKSIDVKEINLSLVDFEIVNKFKENEVEFKKGLESENNDSPKEFFVYTRSYNNNFEKIVVNNDFVVSDEGVKVKIRNDNKFKTLNYYFNNRYSFVIKSDEKNYIKELILKHNLNLNLFSFLK